MNHPLKVFALTTLGVLGYGLWSRAAGSDPEASLLRLLDGDLDGRHRLEHLRLILAAGDADAPHDVRRGVLGAMAALELGDRDGYDRLAAILGGRTPLLPGGGGLRPAALAVEEASLGQPYLASVLRAHLAENDGDRAAARLFFEMAQRSARLFGAQVVADLAAAGIDRLR